MAAEYVLSKTLFPRGAFKNHHRRCRGCGAQPIHRLRTGQLDIAFVAGARRGRQLAACARGHAGGRMGLPTAWVRRPHRLAPRGDLGDPGQPSRRALLLAPDAGSRRSSATHTRASRPRSRRFLAPPGSAVASTASTTPLSMLERAGAGVEFHLHRNGLRPAYGGSGRCPMEGGGQPDPAQSVEVGRHHGRGLTRLASMSSQLER